MTQTDGTPRPLADIAPELARGLGRSAILSPARFAVSKIRVETVMVTMRDGVRLATDLYLPPELPAPAVAMRTPYGRDRDTNAGVFLSFARRGHVVIAQDCRGTGGSEPKLWDYYVYEPEDGYDLVEWVSEQEWFNGFLGSCGGSYDGQTQWCMATHPRMSTIVPKMSGLGIAVNTARLHMFVNMYSRPVTGDTEEGAAGSHPTLFDQLERQMLKETWATGFFNEPLHPPFSEALLTRFPELDTMSPDEAQRWLWARYCSLPCAGRAEFIKQALDIKTITSIDVESLPAIFGQHISHDRHTLPHTRPAELVRSLHAPALLRTGWYDWGLNDALATWQLLRRAAPEAVRTRCRLLITPSAHNMPGYHEGMDTHPELQHAYSPATDFETTLHWYDSQRADDLDAWPTVIYYLMGANEWCAADDWPLPEARTIPLYLGVNGTLTTQAPQEMSEPDRYTYDPGDPTPTVGGSIISYVYPPGSVDVREVQQRPDVLTYTTPPLEHDLDVIGPLRLVLYAGSSAVDTDFAARLSDVFPDGRSIQLQNCLLRARHRDPDRAPQLLEPGEVHRLEIDMWATANRFGAGHRIRVDISSVDFPKYDRNTNRGGRPGPPVPAVQSIYHDPQHPTHLLLPVIGRPLEGPPDFGAR